MLHELLQPATGPLHRLGFTHKISAVQVAILCNHQRSVPKGHVGQMEKMETRLLAVNTELDTLTQELNAAKRGKPLSPGGKVANVDVYAPPTSQALDVQAPARCSNMHSGCLLPFVAMLTIQLSSALEMQSGLACTCSAAHSLM